MARRPLPASAIVQRKKAPDEPLVRKTTHLLPDTAERLDRHCFETRRKLWEVVEQAVREFLDRQDRERRTSRPPGKKSTVPPRASSRPPRKAPT